MQVKTDGLIADIEQIVAKLTMRRGILGNIDGGQAGQSRLGLEPFSKPGISS